MYCLIKTIIHPGGGNGGMMIRRGNPKTLGETCSSPETQMNPRTGDEKPAADSLSYGTTK
jgi:hypothetical protein